MKELFFLLSFICISNLVFSQFQDNFDDNSFPNDPDWFGDTDIYIVNASNELQLMDDDGGQSAVYAFVNTADSTTWEFYFRLEFDPSATNRLKVFLASDSPDLLGDLNGYFLQIGQTGSDDALELWRQDGSTKTMILEGTSGSVASEPSVRIRVTRNESGMWELFADHSGGTDFQLEGSVLDDVHQAGSYFGFHCIYTATRKDKFYFDDIIIGPIAVDDTPPALLNAVPLDANSIEVSFNEALSQSSAEDISNYDIDNGISVSEATLTANPLVVVLSTSMLLSGQQYQLTTSGIEDLSGNPSGQEFFDFVYYEISEPEPYDILITELLPDPDAGVGSLPDAEFFELYNRSNKAFNLAGFEIADASGGRTLPSYIFPPDSYLIICNANALNSFTGYGAAIGISGIFALNDDGDDLSIADADGNIIHAISYTRAWYQDPDKDDGGWSIEMINPNLFCQGQDNWRASNDPAGGTPGQQNSVFDNNPDVQPPSLIDVIPLASDRVRVYFDEIMDANAENPSAYLINGAGSVIEAVLELPQRKTALLTIDAPFFTDQTTYTLTVDEAVSDCSGNGIGVNNTFQFKYYEAQPAARYDILINEIFADPTPVIGLPEQEFIELYNRSGKVINLENFILSAGSSESLLPFQLFMPGQFLIVYRSGGHSFGEYGDTLVLETSFSLPNESGELELIDPQGNTIHAVAYHIDWYRDNTKRNGGWSLELINPDAPCDFEMNWRASVNAAGGTPGRENSVLDKQPDTQSPELVKAYPISPSMVELTFSKALDAATAENPENYVIEGIPVTDVHLLPPLFNVVAITLGTALQEGQIYTISLLSALTDCVGNSAANTFGRVALPQEIDANDIIINEILFNPQTGGQRFIELYNRSSKTLDIGELIVASRNPASNDIERSEAILTNSLLFPNEYVVITSSPADIQSRYFVKAPNALVANTLPTYNDKQGTALIYTAEILGEKIIDEFRYSEDFHNRLLRDKNGVSLERINPDGATNDSNNWHSAATSVGYATPTYQNSQYLETGAEGDDIFSIPNTTLSPDGDGHEDFLLIDYKTDQPGYLASIRIFDAQGRIVKNLVSNELLASAGTFKWDGDTDDGRKPAIGIYVVWIEYFNPDGEVRYMKKTCVVAARLN